MGRIVIGFVLFGLVCLLQQNNGADCYWFCIVLVGLSVTANQRHHRCLHVSEELSQGQEDDGGKETASACSDAKSCSKGARHYSFCN